MTETEFHARRTMLANAFATAGAEVLEHMPMAAGALVPIPDTPLYVVAGDPAAIRAQLDTVDPQRRMRKGERPTDELYWGAATGQARRWSILITEAGQGVVADYGHRFPCASAELERVDVVEVAAPASTVLTDERIEEIWSKECPDAQGYQAAMRFARAIEREVAAQAGQVAVPEGWTLVRGGEDIQLRRADGKWCGYSPEIDSPAHRLTHEFLSAMLAVPSPAKESK